MSTFFKLEKPILSKDWAERALKRFFGSERSDFQKFINSVSGDDYLYWDRVKYFQPSPSGASKEELWSIVKFQRMLNFIPTPIKHEDGHFFNWVKLKKIEPFLHEMDLNTGGEILFEKDLENKKNKQKLIFRGSVEEAIASSQLEGASTSREMAKKFLREGRRPKNYSEQMIFNNYLTMKLLEEDFKDREMNKNILLKLHGLITKDTPTSDGEQPRIRNEKDKIYVTDDKREEIIYHKAPDINFVNIEIEKLISFTNDQEDNSQFIHPIIKAIMIHFWMGYLHPFTDGNGRLARVLFYWYLLKKGYWAFAYLPISKVIKKSPAQYKMAYVYSEQDDYDITYFIDYNIKKIELAVKEFKEYLNQKTKENTTMKVTSKLAHKFNERQIALLQYFNGDPTENTSLKMHMNTNQVSKNTALKDLKSLVKSGFLETKKQGKFIYYYPTNKIKTLFD
ncbi:MAG: Fic family protein [Candidatus Paceibacterota bacterium]|jgi:Fic family protein